MKPLPPETRKAVIVTCVALLVTILGTDGLRRLLVMETSRHQLPGGPSAKPWRPANAKWMQCSEPTKMIRLTPPDADFNSMHLNKEVVLRRYTYKFEGKAMHNGKPCPGATVLVRVMVGKNTIVRGVPAEADGSFSIEVPLDAATNEPVDYTMDAHCDGLKGIELAGRRIVTTEDSVVSVEGKLAFASDKKLANR